MSKSDEIVLPVNVERLRALGAYLRAVETVQVPKTIAIRTKLADLLGYDRCGDDRQRFMAQLQTIEAELDTVRYVLVALREAGIDA